MPTLDDLLEDLGKALEPCSNAQSAAHSTGNILRHYALQNVTLPERIVQETSPCYARHLVFHQEGDGYCVVAMVWGPGQGTPVHDHGGVWCVEGCIQGRLAVTSYRKLGEDESRVQFEAETCVEVGPGSVGCLIPPFEHHKLHNPFQEKAVTLHVYGQELRDCTRYVPQDDGSFAAQKACLAYTTRPN